MIPRFQHILIPLDFTEKNLEALNIAFDLAVVNRARVTLLHVVEQISGEADEELATFYTRLRVRAETELESRSQRFDQVGIVVDCKIRIGRRLHEIVTDSIDRAADLIVMSSHKPDLDRPLQTWATLSYQVSVLCQCPVLLVK
ncbi:MAG: universal stress global response regulator UspA [Schlesneria sp.]|nr:universal stress global response regulator UspA [Schlesneria sp.]